MANSINLQSVQINILDADTKQLIQKNFTIQLYPIDANVYGGSRRTIRGGSEVLTNIPVIHDSVYIPFDQAQVSSYGYDISSIEGNSIQFDTDPTTGLNIMPWVINIYLTKLA